MSAAPHPQTYPGLARAWTTVAILTVAYTLSFIDRYILNLMVGPVRADLGVSDTQMSLLMGFGFAVFYTACGLPMGRLADTRDRRRLIAAGLAFWSLMTALSGTARHYWQLLLFRMGVGIGESALSPAAVSLVADSFPPERRGTAISVYMMGTKLGGGLAFVLGAAVVGFAAHHADLQLPLLGDVRPWQLVFLLLGATGLCFTGVVFLIREPSRHQAGAPVPLSETLAFLRQHARAVGLHHLGFALLTLAAYATAAWLPTTFIRVHGWTAQHIGFVFGCINAGVGALGIVTGGALADRWRARGVSDAGMRVGVLGALLAIPFTAAYLRVANGDLAAGLLVPATFFLSLPLGVGPAALQELMPNRLRGQASALYLFAINLIGLGLGPTAVALLTDYGFQDDHAVGDSLLCVLLAALIGGALALHIGRSAYRASWAAVRAA